MIKLLVIADDFTGALDTGVQFSNYGIETLVLTDGILDMAKITKDTQVLVLNTESRHLSFDQAYLKMDKIIKKAKEENIPYIYKKVDSALRGNISAEIKALLKSSTQSTIPFLPAYPEMNRVLIDGKLYIDGILVSESVFGKDPYEPVIESNIIKRLEKEASIKATLIKKNMTIEEKAGLLVFDGQSDEDLIEQGNLLSKANKLNVSIGCAAFAKFLAQQLFSIEKKKEYDLKKPLVVICGSINPITKKQVEYSERKMYPRISLTFKQLFSSDYWEGEEGQLKIAHYLNLISENQLIVFETFNEQVTNEIEQNEDKAMNDYRFKIGEALGKLTESLWLKNKRGTFLFTGGDTLFQSMKVLGITAIKPLIEIKPGIVLSTIKWQGEERQVITKSGGFGSKELFEELIL